MEERANILVTEVFDTELIGEGAISTFNHAHDYLLTDDCLVIPHSGRVFAQVVSSDLCSKWNSLHDIGQNFIKGFSIVFLFTNFETHFSKKDIVVLSSVFILFTYLIKIL